MALLIARNRNYRLLFSAAAVSSLGDGVSLLALPWLATLVTRDALLIAAVTAAGRLPWFVFSLPAGVLTDRGDRRRMMARADLASCLLTFGIVALILRLPALPLPGGALPWIAALSALTFLLGTAEVLHENAAQTILPEMVPHADLEQANSQIWSVQQVMKAFVGPPLAGALIALAVPAPFAFDAASFALAGLAVWCIALPVRQALPASRGFWREFGEGARWLIAHRPILQLALMLGVLNLVSAMATTALVIYAQELLGLDAARYGLLLTAGAAGGVAGGLTAPWVARRLGQGRTLALALALMPFPYLALWLGHSVTVAALALFAEVVAGMLWNVVTVSLRQRAVPPPLLGRVNSLYRFFGWGMMPLGALLAGGLIAALTPVLGRPEALRSLYLLAAVAMGAMLAYAAVALRVEERG